MLIPTKFPLTPNLWFYGYVSTTKYLHFGIAKNTKL